MTEPDAIMTRIGEGIELHQRGELDAARLLFAAVWEEIGPDGDAFHRCALAHSMADVQDDVHEELVWDLRALQAADSVTDERARQGGLSGSVSWTVRATTSNRDEPESGRSATTDTDG